MRKTNAQRVWEAAEADAVFTTCEYLKRYLSGFAFEDGYVLVDRERTTVYTDSRYLEEAKKFCLERGVSVEEAGGDNRPEKLFSRYTKVAIPYAQTSHAAFEKLSSFGVPLCNADAAFTERMQVKSEEELSSIACACRIADEAFLSLLGDLKEGMTEREVAALLEYRMRSGGAEGTSFDTIVAFGEGAAVPHHRTGERKLRFGDEVLVDFGCKKDGYCSDETRTVLFGDDKKHEEFKAAYAAVREAHLRVIERARTGMTGQQIDALARERLKEKGLDKFFTHSLGHGVGLNIHEEPRLSPKSEQIIVDGMVFSDEPGVYIEGKFGIRIEDTVTMKDGRVQSLLPDSDKKLVII